MIKYICNYCESSQEEDKDKDTEMKIRYDFERYHLCIECNEARQREIKIILDVYRDELVEINKKYKIK